MAVAGCGGGGSTSTQQGASTTAIQIDSVLGNGSGTGTFRDSLIVVGKNFTSGMDVSLKSSGSNFALPYSLDSSTKITANLPTTLTEGNYDLNVADGNSSATHSVTILRGEAGVSITANVLIALYPEDLCTAFAGQDCYFIGGQLVKFSDGSALVTGGFTMLYTDGVSDTDTDGNSITMIVPPSSDGMWQRLSYTVGRSGILASLYFVYTRSPEEVTLVFDTDNDFVLDAGDEIIATLSLSS
ncbi:MAG: hypothetical protein V1798_01245 [Pseudomonadota bacterium]